MAVHFEEGPHQIARAEAEDMKSHNDQFVRFRLVAVHFEEESHRIPQAASEDTAHLVLVAKNSDRIVCVGLVVDPRKVHEAHCAVERFAEDTNQIGQVAEDCNRIASVVLKGDNEYILEFVVAGRPSGISA